MKILFLSIIIIASIFFNFTIGNCIENKNKRVDWPQFGVAFANVKNYDLASQRFNFAWDVPERIQELVKRNKDGDYFRYFVLAKTCPNLSNTFCPDYDVIMHQHPEWILRYQDGFPIIFRDPVFKCVSPQLDIGNPEYVDWLIDWLKQNFYEGKEFGGHIAIDNVDFSTDPRWAKYNKPEELSAAWEYFLKRIAEAFHPQHKVIVNIGNPDLARFSQVVRWIDGVLHENLVYISGHPKFGNLKFEREMILEKLEKGKWCVKNNKIWAVSHIR